MLSCSQRSPTYSQVSWLSSICLAPRERRANLVRQFMLAGSQAGDGHPLPNGILLKFDGHGGSWSLDGLASLQMARLLIKEALEVWGRW